MELLKYKAVTTQGLPFTAHGWDLQHKILMVGERVTKLLSLFKILSLEWSFNAMLVTARPHHGEMIIFNYKKFLTFCESFDLYHLEQYLMQCVQWLARSLPNGSSLVFIGECVCASSLWHTSKAWPMVRTILVAWFYREISVQY